mmetsp:Transcript_24379/g.61101  ORF Transcript_24379/g.61101 Transcript_24379/m.61101 type:complete len:299 (-) Transcript_24379:635-1531(-)
MGVGLCFNVGSLLSSLHLCLLLLRLESLLLCSLLLLRQCLLCLLVLAALCLGDLCGRLRLCRCMCGRLRCGGCLCGCLCRRLGGSPLGGLLCAALLAGGGNGGGGETSGEGTASLLLGRGGRRGGLRRGRRRGLAWRWKGTGCGGARRGGRRGRRDRRSSSCLGDIAGDVEHRVVGDLRGGRRSELLWRVVLLSFRGRTVGHRCGGGRTTECDRVVLLELAGVLVDDAELVVELVVLIEVDLLVVLHIVVYRVADGHDLLGLQLLVLEQDGDAFQRVQMELVPLHSAVERDDALHHLL